MHRIGLSFVVKGLAMMTACPSRTIRLFLLACAAGVAAEPAAGAEPNGLVLCVECSRPGAVVGNRFGDLNAWSIAGRWTKRPADFPADYFRTAFPYVRRIQFMSATGGNEQRDLFKDPRDRSVRDDYDFSRLLAACEQVVAKGLTPMVKTGWVPLKYSAEPNLRNFGTNVRPPDDYEEYYRYMTAMATAVKQRFGVEKVRQWTWGVGVEFENRGWFATADGDARSSFLAYCRLYDTTVAALEDVLGADNVHVGAHAMAVTKGLWDPRQFLEHCLRGQNHRRGTTGTRLDYLAISYYTKYPGFDEAEFAEVVGRIRAAAEGLGRARLTIGVDEGRVLNGWDNKVVWAREVEHPIQAAADALLFHRMVDLDVSWFSTWCLTTEGVFGGIPLTSANLRWLAWRLAEGQRLPVVRSGSPGDANARVDGIAALDANGPIRVLAYHYTPARDANGSQAVRLVLGPLPDRFAGSVLVRRWLLDADHGTWWKPWADILRERSITSADLRDSIWSPQPALYLQRPADRQAWQAREKEFAALACLSASEERLALGPDRTLALPLVLSPHAVVLVEVEPSARATTPGIKIEGKVGHDYKNENLNNLPGKIGPGCVHWPDVGGLLEITPERKKIVDDTIWEVVQGHPYTRIAGHEGGSR